MLAMVLNMMRDWGGEATVVFVGEISAVVETVVEIGVVGLSFCHVDSGGLVRGGVVARPQVVVHH
jgi:hypothetical protein